MVGVIFGGRFVKLFCGKGLHGVTVVLKSRKSVFWAEVVCGVGVRNNFRNYGFSSLSGRGVN